MIQWRNTGKRKSKTAGEGGGGEGGEGGGGGGGGGGGARGGGGAGGGGGGGEWGEVGGREVGGGNGEEGEKRRVRGAVERRDGIVNHAAVSRVVWGERDPDLWRATKVGGLQSVLDAAES